MNFILSSFFLTNSKRLNGRSTFIKSLFMHKTDKLYNEIGNPSVKEKDCTLNRLTYLFLKDVRPFGTIKSEEGICREFNFAPWVELYSAVKGNIDEYNPFELEKVREKLVDARKNAKFCYIGNKEGEVDDRVFEAGVYRHCISLFETRFGKSNNFNYENINNKIFVANMNNIIKQIQTRE